MTLLELIILINIPILIIYLIKMVYEKIKQKTGYNK